MVLIFAEALESNFKEADLEGWCQQEGNTLHLFLLPFGVIHFFIRYDL